MFDVLAVFHGGTDEIRFPKVNVGRDRLDFGPGFYVTDIYPQAKDWAIKISERRELRPVINTYHLHKKQMYLSEKGKIFNAYDEDWLEFVTQSRLGYAPWAGLSYIEGGVADDNVVDTVRLYMNGYIGSEEAIRRLKYFKPANQICILNQEIIGKYLEFIKAEEL